MYERIITEKTVSYKYRSFRPPRVEFRNKIIEKNVRVCDKHTRTVLTTNTNELDFAKRLSYNKCIYGRNIIYIINISEIELSGRINSLRI